MAVFRARTRMRRTERHPPARMRPVSPSPSGGRPAWELRWNPGLFRTRVSSHRTSAKRGGRPPSDTGPAKACARRFETVRATASARRQRKRHESRLRPGGTRSPTRRSGRGTRTRQRWAPTSRRTRPSSRRRTGSTTGTPWSCTRTSSSRSPTATRGAYGAGMTWLAPSPASA